MEFKIEEKNSSNNSIHNENNNLIEKSNKKTPEKRKRRGKKDLEGRQFICEYCKKAYLSKPALNSHLNSKHKEELIKNNIQKKNDSFHNAHKSSRKNSFDKMVRKFKHSKPNEIHKRCSNNSNRPFLKIM